MTKRAKKTATLTSLQFRKKALSTLINQIGVYALCDLDGVPIYVGQSVDGIRERVLRHTTSARSDVIANRLVDVWEIAFVKAWPLEEESDVAKLEAVLFHTFDAQKTLMNGSIPRLLEPLPPAIPEPAQIVQVMTDDDMKVRRDPMLRLPRQIEHIGRLVDHILSVKDSPQLRRALKAHFERLDAYREAFLESRAPVIRKAGQADDV